MANQTVHAIYIYTKTFNTQGQNGQSKTNLIEKNYTSILLCHFKYYDKIFVSIYVICNKNYDTKKLKYRYL